jgi:flagellar assembly protein FliH
MSSSSSAAAPRFVVVSRDGDGERRQAGNPALTRARVLRGFSFDRGASPLDAELPGPPVEVDPAQAAADARRGYDAGFEAGFAEGISAGRAAAAAETAAALAHLEALGRSLAEAAEELRRHRALDLAGLEDALARTAVDLASAIIGRELEVAASPGADALARALGLVPAGCVAVARVHPGDCDTVGELPGGVTVIADPAIEPGGCILEVGDSRIDAQLGPALDRVRSALLGDR